jgi:hypothetical protein
MNGLATRIREIDMSKVYPSCLLLTLVFTNAHAPTFLFGPQTAATTPEQTLLANANVGARNATRDIPAGTSALLREYAESDDIKRFQVDQFNLPDLDVSLPELFDWSDAEHAYLAQNGIPPETFDLSLDSSIGAAFRYGSFASGGGAGSSAAAFTGVGRSAAGNSSGPTAASSGQASKSDSDSPSNGEETEQTPNSEQPSAGNDGTQLADNTAPPSGYDPPGTDGTPNLYEPIPTEQSPAPVPVPVPGTLGLFALGLAGLQLAGRNKKKRLAATRSLIRLR